MKTMIDNIDLIERLIAIVCKIRDIETRVFSKSDTEMYNKAYVEQKCEAIRTRLKFLNWILFLNSMLQNNQVNLFQMFQSSNKLL